MRIAVAGAQGQLGRCLAEAARRRPGVHFIGLSRSELDLLRPDGMMSVLVSARPDIVINAAAYTRVDQAEAEPDIAFAINRDGAAALAVATASLKIPIVQISTDYVFAGDKGTPYKETDGASPLNVYGRSKLEGEIAVKRENPRHLIVRTAWTFSPFGQNFLKRMLALARQGKELRIVDDQTSNPTSGQNLAEVLLLSLDRFLSTNTLAGTYHMAGSEPASWFDFASHIMMVARASHLPSVPVRAIKSSEYPTAAKRPSDSRLNTSALATAFDLRLKSWRDETSSVVHQLIATDSSNEHG
jgi:dTDP-4-dehydrorhamnose reductase